MLIRECAAADFESIWLLNETAFGYKYDLGKTQKRLDMILNRQADKILVACIEDEIVGYIHGNDYECTYSDSLKNIMSIAVDESRRGQGIGKALLSSIEIWAKDCGCCGVRLVSGSDRTGAHEFYLACGYTNRKQQKNFIKYFD